MRRGQWLESRGPGCLRHCIHHPRPAGDQGWQFRRRDRAVAGHGRQGASDRAPRRAAAESADRQDRLAQAGIPRGRHGDGGQFQLHFRWCRRAGADAPEPGCPAWPQAPGGDPRSCGVCRYPEPVSHRTDWRREETDAKNRLVAGSSRPVRSQRSLCRGGAGDHGQAGDCP
ncbi:hypothetical protein D3C84_904330 [compost metagenome]